jgi:hypothetical protein
MAPRLQRRCILLKPLVILSPNLLQERKVRRSDGKLRQWLNRHEPCELCNVNFLAINLHGWLAGEWSSWLEADGSHAPRLTWQSRLAQGSGAASMLPRIRETARLRDLVIFKVIDVDP